MICSPESCIREHFCAILSSHGRRFARSSAPALPATPARGTSEWQATAGDRGLGNYECEQYTVSGSVDELKRMILGGVEMVLRPEGGGEAEARPNRYQQTLLACAENSVSGWLRVALGEGIEIHLSDKRPKMTPEQRGQMLRRIEELVKEIYG